MAVGIDHPQPYPSRTDPAAADSRLNPYIPFMKPARRTIVAFFASLLGASTFAIWDPPATAPALSPPAATPASPAKKTTSAWYTISMGGQQAGYQHEVRTISASTTTTEQTAVISLRRGDSTIKNRLESTFVETADHKPVSMTLRRELGAEPVSETFTFREKDVAVKSTQGTGKAARISERIEPLPHGPWMTPAAAHEFLVQRQTAGAKEISFRTIDPSAGIAASTETYTFIERTSLTVAAKPIPSWKYKLASSKLQGIIQTVWLDELGALLRAEMDVGGVHMTTVWSTREDALRQAAGPEIMVATFVKPDKPIRTPRAITSASFTLRSTSGDLPDLPTAGSQAFTRIDKASARVTINLQTTSASADAELSDATASSSAIGKDDPEIVALARRALEKLHPDADDSARVEAIRSFVHEFITNKNLASGFATAGEVARSKSGDCTEHAVLAAALLRASGIPARVASGLVYADQFSGERNVFAYHMWTQAAVTPSGASPASKAARVWIDTDATLDKQRFDGTHITLAVTALKDGEFETAMVSVIRVLGQLSITVGETTTAPASAPGRGT